MQIKKVEFFSLVFFHLQLTIKIDFSEQVELALDIFHFFIRFLSFFIILLLWRRDCRTQAKHSALKAHWFFTALC